MVPNPGEDGKMGNSYETFFSQLEEAVAAFPCLKIVNVKGQDILKGKLSVVDREGKHWEDYEIEIHASERFPFEFPYLFETSGKIPRIADWHIYEDTGTCCVKVQPEEIIRCKHGITVTEFIGEEVVPYLFNQTHRRIEGYYVNGEYAHGWAGIFQFYSSVLKTGNDIPETIRLMKLIAESNRPERTSFCFCGRNIKFRCCHREAFDQLKLMDKGKLLGHAKGIAQAAGLNKLV